MGSEWKPKTLGCLSSWPCSMSKSSTTSSHCVGLAQMAGEIWQQDSTRSLAPSLISTQGFSLQLYPPSAVCGVLLSETPGIFPRTTSIAFCQYKKKGNWTWEREGHNITIQSKLLFLVIREFYSSLTETGLRFLHEDNVILGTPWLHSIFVSWSVNRSHYMFLTGLLRGEKKTEHVHVTVESNSQSFS